MSPHGEHADWNRALLEEVLAANAGRTDVGMVGTTRATDADLRAFGGGTRPRVETTALSYSFVVKQVLERALPYAVMNMYSAADCDADEEVIERQVTATFPERSYERRWMMGQLNQRRGEVACPKWSGLYLFKQGNPFVLIAPPAELSARGLKPEVVHVVLPVELRFTIEGTEARAEAAPERKGMSYLLEHARGMEDAHKIYQRILDRLEDAVMGVGVETYSFCRRAFELWSGRNESGVDLAEICMGSQFRSYIGVMRGALNSAWDIRNLVCLNLRLDRFLQFFGEPALSLRT
jgi:hypothetical protein